MRYSMKDETLSERRLADDRADAAEARVDEKREARAMASRREP